MKTIPGCPPSSLRFILTTTEIAELDYNGGKIGRHPT